MADMGNANQELTADLQSSIRKEAIAQVAKYTIGAIGSLVGIAALGWWLYIKQEADKYIGRRIAGGVPVSAVVAFDIADGCPQGWTLFGDGVGRMIIGAGKADSLTRRGFRSTNDTEAVVLKETNMPQHQHETLVGVSTATPWGTGPAKGAVVGRGFETFATAMSNFAGKNPPDAVSIMPPFIALTLCKKNP